MNNIAKSPPLIITLKIDEKSQAYFNEQRKKYYPAHFNYVDAHITLFHKLPSNKIEIERVLEKCSNKKTFDISVTNIVLQNTGIAYEIISDELMLLHKEMQQELAPYLIRNDRKQLWPHITIQNKVTEYKAFKTHAALLPSFEPITVTSVGFSCWYYLKGFWEAKGDYMFD